MNRLVLSMAAGLSAASLLLVDTAVKGTVLLALAAVAALMLRRDSAATRHLVWLLAIVAILVAPILSAMLPQWRVLPAWAGQFPQERVLNLSLAPLAERTNAVAQPPQGATPVDSQPAAATPSHPADRLSGSRGTSRAPAADPTPAVQGGNWLNALALVWGVGCSVLTLRLSAARWMLGNTERGATVIGTSPATQDPLASAAHTICTQLGIGRPVTLLIHSGKTIPVVWGVFRCRLLLPAAARQWSEEQLRSVLVHELGHIKRGDAAALLLTQIACALHWFNPLVWFAAWRLDVERERACDDLVLSSGVRPSAYAGHLLEIVSTLSPVRWSQTCGLAMARKSPLEGRLTAVLQKNLNRRGLSAAVAGIFLAVAVGVAVPIAMLRAADDRWEPPHAAHIGGDDFSTYCVHDGKKTAFVIAYHGPFDSATESTSNAKTQSWTDTGRIVVKKSDIELGFLRTHAAPGKITITTVPANARVLSRRQPAPRHFSQTEYDLAKGRVFLLADNGQVRQFDLAVPLVTDQEAASNLAELIATVTPPERLEDMPTNTDEPKITPESLLGFWKGTLNDESIRISFHRPPAETEVQCDIYFGDATIGAVTPFQIAEDGRSVTLTSLGRSQRGADHGILTPGDSETLQLEFAGAQPNPGKVVLTLEDDPAASEPRQSASREMFELWNRTANADGTLPGTFIGMLAGEVRAYVKAHPTYDSAQKLQQLLPRFVTSRDWTTAEAIQLLDDVAYYSTAPIEALVAKAKQPSDAHWRTTLPFEDIPVVITQWSEATDGLRIGMRVVEGEWRVGGKVRLELWLHNTGDSAVTFRSTGPDRQDVGLAVSVVGTDGRVHSAQNANILINSIPTPCMLPAGYVTKAKDIDLSFDAPDNRKRAWLKPKFRELAPGDYKLRCVWLDPNPNISVAGEWTGELTTVDHIFTLVDAAASKP